MLIKVRVVPNSKLELLERIGTRSYKLKVRAKATGGLANAAAVKALASHFGVPASKVSILKGKASREKVVQVEVAEV